MQELYANNTLTTLASGVPAAATTINLAIGTGAAFPNPANGQFFRVSLTDQATQTIREIMFCTARSGDALTVTRAQEGTTAQNWSTGDYASNNPTAGMFANLIQSGEYDAIDSGSANAGVITLSPAPASLAAIQGTPINIAKMGSPNSGAYTLNVNGLGAQPVALDGAALASGQLLASGIFQVVWDGTQFELQSFPGAVSNAQLAPMAAGTLKGNLGAGSGQPSDVPLASLLAALGFGAASLAANGYLIVPVLVSGAIVEVYVQWGSQSSTNANFNFPIAFPNACLQFIPGNSAHMGAYSDPAYGYAISPSQFFLATQNSSIGAVSAYPASWIAIGH